MINFGEGIRRLRKADDLVKIRLNDSEKRVLLFLYRWIRPIRAGDLRKKLEEDYDVKIPHSTLNSIIKSFEELKMVIWERYGPISLTKKGSSMAAHITRHCHLLTLFFVKSLGFTHDEAEMESILICPRASCRLIQRIEQELDIPLKCICDEKIPSYESCLGTPMDLSPKTSREDSK